MSAKKWYVVTSKTGLNLRESPSLEAKILSVLKFDDRIEADNSKLEETPEDWLPVKDGGYVMREFVK